MSLIFFARVFLKKQTTKASKDITASELVDIETHVVAATYSNTSTVSSIVRPGRWRKCPLVCPDIQFIAKALQDPGKNCKSENSTVVKHPKIEALGK